jgi:hypothetical protein
MEVPIFFLFFLYFFQQAISTEPLHRSPPYQLMVSALISLSHPLAIAIAIAITIAIVDATAIALAITVGHKDPISFIKDPHPASSKSWSFHLIALKKGGKVA